MVNFIGWGEKIERIPDELANSQLLGLMHACEEHPDFRVVELRRFSTPQPYVGIVVEACDGTIAPQNSVGILPRERLCLSYQQGAATPAEVRALRSDFPDVLHLNGVDEHEPASLCLYESWSFEERRWTPQRHLARILWWLRCSSDGTLHAQDQGLEQLFYDTGYVVVLPVEFNDQPAEALGLLYLTEVKWTGKRIYLIVASAKPERHGSLIQPLVVDVPPISNQPVQRAARTLGELDDQLRRLGSELEPHLSQAVKRQSRILNGEAALSGSLLLLLRVPRMRDEKIERVDVRGFLVADGFEQVGIKLGALFRPQLGKPAFAVDDIAIGASKPDQADKWRTASIELVDPRSMPSRQHARAMSGIDDEGADFAGVLAGVGSLGSALADMWVRGGWGRWTYIDHDEVSPHNLVRHHARSGEVGLSKAHVVQAQSAHALGRGCDGFSAICAKANDAEVENALMTADLLVDASTTIEVPRDWSELDLPRSASVFFTFSGSSAVLLVEDRARQVRLSSLEAQYYRAILTQEWGEAHLERPGRVRVGAGCRDHSLVLSYELVLLHAAQLSRRLRKAVSDAQGSIQVWTLDDATGGITAASVPVHTTRSRQFGEWSVRWDDGLVAKMRAMRRVKLPSETGGILVGVIDQKLRTITIVDACEAPADSQEEANSFVRGTEGGQAYVSRCERLTAGMVGYVGEWHSHPQGHSTKPSATDILLLGTLTMRLRRDGIPVLMVIVTAEDFGVSLGTTA